MTLSNEKWVDLVHELVWNKVNERTGKPMTAVEENILTELLEEIAEK